MFPVDYEQSLSIFFFGPLSKTPETRKWPRAWLKARDGRGCRPCFLRLAALPLKARARVLHLLNLKKKKDCSQSTFPVVIRILSILKFFVCCRHRDIDFTKNCILTKFISKSIAGENSLNFIRLLRVVITPQVTCESTGRRHSLPEKRVVILIGWLSKHSHNYV